MKKSSLLNRLHSVVLCLCMVLSLMPRMPLTASAASAVSYVDYAWDAETQTLSSETKSVTDYTTVTSTTTAMSGGWYVVTGEVTVSERMIVTGEVHLLLTDGSHLNAVEGIGVDLGNSLYIYGQASDEAVMGKLTATTTSTYSAVIGATSSSTKDLLCGTIVINGGYINATTDTTGAAIGGGYEGSGGNITITGGTVNATSRDYGAAIGGGYGGSGGNITITGGTVNATSRDYGAAIGGGYGGSGGNITITGGTVTATNTEASSRGGSGIGGGYLGSGGNILITGGTVTATGGWGAAGIGGYSDAGNITITGGTVSATGNVRASAIGGGVSDSVGGSITILGGTVTATKHSSGINDIGAGEKGPPVSMMLLNGNTVTVTGSHTLYVDYAIPQGTTVFVSEGASLTIPDGITLTVTEGAAFDLSTCTLEDIIWNGTVVNQGLVKLPEGFALDNAPKGGTVAIGQRLYCWSQVHDKWICPEGQHVGGIATCSELAVCEECGVGYGTLAPGNHIDNTNTQNTDNGDNTHSVICSECGEAVTSAGHKGGSATCAKLAVCEDCGVGYGTLVPDNHIDNTNTQNTDNGDNTHSVICSECGEAVTSEGHKGGSATCAKLAVCEDCGVGYGTLVPDNHIDNTNTQNTDNGDNTHSVICSECDGAISIDAHKGGTATCSKLAVCEDCGVEYGYMDYYNHVGETYVEYEWYPYEDGSCYVYATLYCADCDGYVDSNSGDAELIEDVAPINCQNSGKKVWVYSCTFDDQQYTETYTEIIKSQNHVGELVNGFCDTCGGYEQAVWNEDAYLYEISNAGQLYWYAQQVNENNAEMTVKLMADIVIPENAPNWVPITGSYVTFDGNFHTVSGVRCVGGENDEYVGFFGNEGWWYDIKNLHITDSYFEGSHYVGALIACFSNGGNAVNCAVTNTTVKGDYYAVGGLVGYLGAHITNCYSTATVVGAEAGLLVGYQPSGYGEIVNCYYLADAETEDGGKTATQFASGEVAYLLQSGVAGEDIYDDDWNYVETIIHEIWGQTIGEENVPVLGGQKVYQVISCDGETGIYSNTNANLEHNWQAATCTEPAYCANCFMTKGSALGHYGAQGACSDYICFNCGEPTPGTGQHQYETDCATYCYNCFQDTRLNPPANHVSDAEYPCQNGYCMNCNSKVPAQQNHSFVNGICGVCGEADPDYSDPIVIPTLTLKAPTLEFKDMITVNAMFTAENLDDVVEMGMITYTEKVDEWSVETANHVIPGTTYDVNTGRYIAASQGIHAKYLGDTVYLACYAKLTDGSYTYSKLAGYSPVQYATSKLKGTDTALKQLVVAMLNYGAAAQNHFGHNVENLANATLSAEQIALPEAYRSDMVSTVASPAQAKQGAFYNNKGFSKRYPSISFEGAFCINYFFTPAYAPVGEITLYYWNTADYEAAEVLTVENATGSLTMEIQDNGEYRSDIAGIAAKALGDGVYVVGVYTDGVSTWTSGVLGYSIGAYCASQSTKGGTIADLAMATAVYGYHAKVYFG